MYNRKKIIILAFVLVIILIGISIYNSSKKNKSTTSNSSNEKISTDEVAIDLTQYTKNSRLAKDYTNFTDTEKQKVYEKYGYDNVKFTNQGLIVKRVEYADNLEERLYTNIWPDTNLTNSVIKPEFGEIGEIEVGETYLYILLEDVTEKDLKNYAKEVKKEFSEEIKTKNKSVIYKGRNANRSKVIISFNESKDIGIIHYDF